MIRLLISTLLMGLPTAESGSAAYGGAPLITLEPSSLSNLQMEDAAVDTSLITPSPTPLPPCCRKGRENGPEHETVDVLPPRLKSVEDEAEVNTSEYEIVRAGSDKVIEPALPHPLDIYAHEDTDNLERYEDSPLTQLTSEEKKITKQVCCDMTLVEKDIASIKTRSRTIDEHPQSRAIGSNYSPTVSSMPSSPSRVNINSFVTIIGSLCLFLLFFRRFTRSRLSTGGEKACANLIAESAESAERPSETFSQSTEAVSGRELETC